MTMELKVAVDPAVGRKHALRLLWRSEPLHLLLSSSCRLMRHLGAVIEVSALPMLDTWEGFPLDGGIALQLIGDGYAQSILRPTRKFAEGAVDIGAM
jgi:hypothetical protein